MAIQHPITRALITVIQHSHQPMVVTDPNLPDHPMIAVNDAFDAISGYPRGQTVGRNCRFLQGAGTDPKAPVRIRTCIAEQRGCVEWVLNYRANGDKFWNLLFISPVFAPDGTLLNYFGSQRDITEGPPAELPDYTLGRADMPAEGEREFHALLRGLADEDAAGMDAAAGARRLERLVDTARRIDGVATRLAPAAWEPPPRSG